MAGGANTNIGRAFLQQSGMLGDRSVPSYIPPSQLSSQKTGAGSSNITPMPTMSNDLLRQAVPQNTQPTSISPIVQQMAQRIQAENSPFNFGLQSLYGVNRPAMMPMYQNPALGYRPNMQQVQQNLSRVQPSVYKTDLDAARARIAELEAAQQSQNNDNYWVYNQG